MEVMVYSKLLARPEVVVAVRLRSALLQQQTRGVMAVLVQPLLFLVLPLLMQEEEGVRLIPDTHKVQAVRVVEGRLSLPVRQTQEPPIQVVVVALILIKMAEQVAQAS